MLTSLYNVSENCNYISPFICISSNFSFKNFFLVFSDIEDFELLRFGDFFLLYKLIASRRPMSRLRLEISLSYYMNTFPLPGWPEARMYLSLYFNLILPKRPISWRFDEFEKSIPIFILTSIKSPVELFNYVQHRVSSVTKNMHVFFIDFRNTDTNVVS